MNIRHRLVRAGALSVPALAVLVACAAPTDTEGQSRTASVEYVIDGDTIIVDGGERVRFLGIDAPEVARDGSKAEPCADEATTVVEDSLKGATVTLTPDETQPPQDRYGRTLAYVEVDGTDLSAQLLEAGLADLYRAASTISRYSHYQDLAATAPTPACRG